MTAAATAETFDPAAIMGLPEPARRWLGHAIAPGTPLWGRAELTMHGQIKLGRWRPFTARQVLTPPGGYLWAARTRLAGLPVTGYDRLGSGGGEMHWRLMRLIPVQNGSGPDVTRSAHGRLAGEIVLIPTAFRHASWSRGEHAGTTVGTWRFGDDTEAAELLVKPDGRLAGVRISRWGSPGGAPFRRYPFGVRIEAESRFGGITIPSVFRAAWGDSDFLRAEITGAVFSQGRHR
jgi:Family of unknown function (DUF6544)